jgi:tetratricopeptide (TPR) repeat protein/transcriptional regulator with XRE-family HTH domain
MKTFSQLLTEHARRTGVSDAELARHLGVRRQTIFRWKEGVTKRPRERVDVLRLAEKLRLSSEERDALLLAAGFAPETVPAVAQTHAVQEDAPAAIATLPWRWLLLASLLLVLLLGSLLFWENGQRDAVRYSGSLALGATATPDESLILVAQFANYGGEKLGYNVAGRLAEAVTAAGPEDVRVQVVPEIIETEAQARQLAQAQRALIIIWGEYDSGRVLAHVLPLQTGASSLEVRHLLDDFSALNTTINAELPQEVQWLALVTLGQVHYLNQHYTQAEYLFGQALQQHAADVQGLDVVYFYLGLLAYRAQPPALDESIAYFTQALDLTPGFVTALNNRAAAYLRRQAAGDSARALADLQRVVALRPQEASGHYNLGLALGQATPPQLQEARVEFEKAYALNPQSPGVNNALCWDYALEAQPQKALPFCDNAVALDSSGNSHDSRGVARAQLGDLDGAIADFQYYLTHYQAVDANAYAHDAPVRRAWVQALQAGRNPMDAATLAQLRNHGHAQ